MRTVFQDQFINIHGIRTRYWTAGETGPTVLLVHGLGGSVDYWGETIRILSPYYRVYAIDLVGAGLSDKPYCNYERRFLANFLQQALEALKLAPVRLVGHSLGGSACLLQNIRKVELVERMVLVSTGGLSKEVSFSLRLLSVPWFGKILFRTTRKKVLSNLRSIVHNKLAIEDWLIDVLYRNTTLPGAQRTFLNAVHSNINLLGAKSDPRNAFSEIKIPTFVIWGEQDPVTPLIPAQRILKFLPKDRVRIFDLCGHLPHIEYPEKFHETLLEFLSCRV